MKVTLSAKQYKFLKNVLPHLNALNKLGYVDRIETILANGYYYDNESSFSRMSYAKGRGKDDPLALNEIVNQYKKMYRPATLTKL